MRTPPSLALGSLSDGVNASGGAGVGSAPPGLSPAPSAGTSHGSTHGSGSHGGSTTTSPSAMPSASQSSFTYPPNDYHVTATGSCAWDTDQVGDLFVNVEFTIDHTGPDAADPVPWRMSNDANNYNTTGTAATLPKTFTVRTGGQDVQRQRVAGPQREVHDDDFADRDRLTRHRQHGVGDVEVPRAINRPLTC